jgi:hypothetical protein
MMTHAKNKKMEIKKKRCEHKKWVLVLASIRGTYCTVLSYTLYCTAIDTVVVLVPHHFSTNLSSPLP